METQQFQSLATVMTLLNRYYSFLRVNHTAIPEAAVLCEAIEELFAPRFVWVQGVFRWPNKEPLPQPDGSNRLSSAGVNHHWLVLHENRDIIVDIVPALALKGFETPLVVKQGGDSDARAFIGYFPNKVQASPESATIALQIVRIHMNELLISIKSPKARPR